jgi:hypothetical protein
MFGKLLIIVSISINLLKFHQLLPQEIVFIFICYAGITEGILKPLHLEMFSENSWFYLSRYVFLNVFIYNVIAGIFSDTWLPASQTLVR